MTNLMTKNLKYKIGNQNHLLLKPQLVRGNKPEKGKNFVKYMGYI